MGGRCSVQEARYIEGVENDKKTSIIKTEFLQIRALQQGID